MKKYAFVFLLLLATACTKANPPTVESQANPMDQLTNIPIGRSHEGSVVQISDADRACKTDDDCTTVMTHCSCDCGSGVSKAKVKYYADQKEAACKDYEGRKCKMKCDGKVKCEDQLCTYVQ